MEIPPHQLNAWYDTIEVIQQALCQAERAFRADGNPELTGVLHHARSLAEVMLAELEQAGGKPLSFPSPPPPPLPEKE